MKSGSIATVIPNPFHLMDHREGEDRVTYAFGAALAAGDGALVVALLRTLGAEVPDATGPIEVEFQPPGPTSRPDARFDLATGMAVFFENKIVPGALYRDQILRHIASFGTVRHTSPKVLLAITPDDQPPDWWMPLAKEHPTMVFVHGSWRRVRDWARLAAAEDGRGELSQFLLKAFVEYLEERSGMTMTTATFDSQRMDRVAQGAGNWLDDLTKQHAAQEAFFADVASRLRSALGQGEDEPWIKVASRWGETWTPVSTYIEFWWPTPTLSNMPVTHMWGEAYLDEKTKKIELRTGILFEGKAQVAAWYGTAQEVAAHTFGDRYWNYRRGGAYAEVWASQPLNLAQLPTTAEAVANDFLTWVTKALPEMATTAGQPTGKPVP